MHDYSDHHPDEMFFLLFSLSKKQCVKCLNCLSNTAPQSGFIGFRGSGTLNYRNAETGTFLKSWRIFMEISKSNPAKGMLHLAIIIIIIILFMFV